jgi:hypothetical protein
MMPTVSFTHTEINPSHSEGSGGGVRSHVVTEQTPTPAVGFGGGRRVFVKTELSATQVIGAGGGRRVFVLEEIPPVLSLPLPEVTTGPATEIGFTEATINGFLKEDGGFLCDIAFEWGLTDSYGNITPAQTRTAGEHFSQVLSRLEPDTVYHFRALAANVFGLSRGVDRAFRTSNTMPPPYFQEPLISLLEEEIL